MYHNPIKQNGLSFYAKSSYPYNTYVILYDNSTNDTLPISYSCCHKCKIYCELKTPRALLVNMYRIVILEVNFSVSPLYL